MPTFSQIRKENNSSQSSSPTTLAERQSYLENRRPYNTNVISSALKISGLDKPQQRTVNNTVTARNLTKGEPTQSASGSEIAAARREAADNLGISEEAAFQDMGPGNIFTSALTGIDDLITGAYNTGGNAIDAAWDNTIANFVGWAAGRLDEEAGNRSRDFLQNMFTGEDIGTGLDVASDIALAALGPAGIAATAIKNGLQNGQEISEAIEARDYDTGETLDPMQVLARLGGAGIDVGTSLIGGKGFKKAADVAKDQGVAIGKTVDESLLGNITPEGYLRLALNSNKADTKAAADYLQGLGLDKEASDYLTDVMNKYGFKVEGDNLVLPGTSLSGKTNYDHFNSMLDDIRKTALDADSDSNKVAEKILGKIASTDERSGLGTVLSKTVKDNIAKAGEQMQAGKFKDIPNTFSDIREAQKYNREVVPVKNVQLEKFSEAIAKDPDFEKYMSKAFKGDKDASQYIKGMIRQAKHANKPKASSKSTSKFAKSNDTQSRILDKYSDTESSAYKNLPDNIRSTIDDIMQATQSNPAQSYLLDSYKFSGKEVPKVRDMIKQQASAFKDRHIPVHMPFSLTRPQNGLGAANWGSDRVVQALVNGELVDTKDLKKFVGDTGFMEEILGKEKAQDALQDIISTAMRRTVKDSKIDSLARNKRALGQALGGETPHGNIYNMLMGPNGVLPSAATAGLGAGSYALSEMANNGANWEDVQPVDIAQSLIPALLASKVSAGKAKLPAQKAARRNMGRAAMLGSLGERGADQYVVVDPEASEEDILNYIRAYGNEAE